MYTHMSTILFAGKIRVLVYAQSFQMLAHEGLFADPSEALAAKMNRSTYVPCSIRNNLHTTQSKY
jgi:hypothetical protein